MWAQGCYKAARQPTTTATCCSYQQTSWHGYSVNLTISSSSMTVIIYTYYMYIQEKTINQEIFRSLPQKIRNFQEYLGSIQLSLMNLRLHCFREKTPTSLLARSYQHVCWVGCSPSFHMLPNVLLYVLPMYVSDVFCRV